MDFGWALDTMRQGGMVTRANWGGASWIALRSGYPNGIKVDEHTQRELDVPAGTFLVFRPYIAMVTATNQVMPWTASVDAILATDWEQVGTSDHECDGM